MRLRTSSIRKSASVRSLSRSAAGPPTTRESIRPMCKQNSEAFRAWFASARREQSGGVGGSGLDQRRLRAALKVVLVSMLGYAVLCDSIGAANEPCSGKKGGIASCRGETFVCNDGSVSGSKKSCQAYMGGAGFLGGGTSNMTPVVGGECDCRSGLYCTGPRGGRFCISDSGAKSYLRK